jgi:hypothetical protein
MLIQTALLLFVQYGVFDGIHYCKTNKKISLIKYLMYFYSDTLCSNFSCLKGIRNETLSVPIWDYLETKYVENMKWVGTIKCLKQTDKSHRRTKPNNIRIITFTSGLLKRIA